MALESDQPVSVSPFQLLVNKCGKAVLPAQD